MTGPTSGYIYNEQEVRELVLAARDAAEELYIVTRMGTRRAEPVKRWQRLVEALRPFAATEA